MRLYLAQWYSDLAEATEAARTAAAALVMAGPGAASQHVTAATVAEWFEWDGAPVVRPPRRGPIRARTDPRARARDFTCSEGVRAR